MVMSTELLALLASSFLALVGVIGVPIIYRRWWNSLLGREREPVQIEQATVMLQGMLVMTQATWCYCIACTLREVRSIVLEREGHSHWV